MKSMVVLSALVALASAQIPYPGFAGGPYNTAYLRSAAYAPAFAYSSYGTPASTAPLPAASATALDVFAPYAAAAPVAAPAYGFPYHAGYATGYFPGLNYGFGPAAVAAAVAAPAAAFAAAAPAPAPAAVAVEAAPAPVVKAVEVPAAAAAPAEEDAVVVVEADSAPLVATGPVNLRAIFPIFQSDFRSGSGEGIVFARPDQIVPVKPAVVKEDSDELPGVIAPDFSRSFPVRPVAPAGILQATQPRFFVPSSNFATPVFTA